MPAKFQDPTIPQTWSNPRWPPFSVKICYTLYKNIYIKKNYEYISLIFLQCVGRVYAHMPVKSQNPILPPTSPNPRWLPYFLRICDIQSEKYLSKKKLCIALYY